jgi:hypothetical protein
LNRQKQNAAKGGLRDMDIAFTVIGLLIGLVSLIVTLALKEKKKLRRNKDDGFYYEDGDEDNPYCPKCYAKKQKRVLVDKDSRKCPKCKTVFERPPVVIEVCPRQKPKVLIRD